MQLGVRTVAWTPVFSCPTLCSLAHLCASAERYFVPSAQSVCVPIFSAALAAGHSSQVWRRGDETSRVLAHSACVAAGPIAISTRQDIICNGPPPYHERSATLFAIRKRKSRQSVITSRMDPTTKGPPCMARWPGMTSPEGIVITHHPMWRSNAPPLVTDLWAVAALLWPPSKPGPTEPDARMEQRFETSQVLEGPPKCEKLKPETRRAGTGNLERDVPRGPIAPTRPVCRWFQPRVLTSATTRRSLSESVVRLRSCLLLLVSR